LGAVGGFVIDDCRRSGVLGDRRWEVVWWGRRLDCGWPAGGAGGAETWRKKMPSHEVVEGWSCCQRLTNRHVEEQEAETCARKKTSRKRGSGCAIGDLSQILSNYIEMMHYG
jgi:hypothetical protein